MDPIPASLASVASRRALLGARLDDPVLPDSSPLPARALRALARRHHGRAGAGRAPAVTRWQPAAGVHSYELTFGGLLLLGARCCVGRWPYPV